MNYIKTKFITYRAEVDSRPYSVDCKAVGNGDILIVNILCDMRSIRSSFWFYGADIIYKDTIEFEVKERERKIKIHWIGVNPILIDHYEKKQLCLETY